MFAKLFQFNQFAVATRILIKVSLHSKLGYKTVGPSTFFKGPRSALFCGE
jgi:hypothetical protein